MATKPRMRGNQQAKSHNTIHTAGEVKRFRTVCGQQRWNRMASKLACNVRACLAAWSRRLRASRSLLQAAKVGGDLQICQLGGAGSGEVDVAAEAPRYFVLPTAGVFPR